jgi:amidase
MAISFDDYRRHDATGLARAIRRGDFTAAEAMQAAMARLRAVNPVVNAVSWLDEALADRLCRGEADPSAAADGPLAGVPYFIKDLHAPVRGVPLRHGSRLFIDQVLDFDSETVARLRRAGLRILGRTASPEFGMNVSTEPALTGATRNPWSLAHSAGGSSGGAAAAVAAGILPAAHATDSGGSIRIPASVNGLVGLKPTRGLIPTGPHRGDASYGMSHEHAVTRSVRDCAALLDAVVGPDVGAPYFTQAPATPYRELIEQPLRRLKVGFMLQDFSGNPVHEDCAQAVQATARRLSDMGHLVEPAAPSFDAQALGSATTTLLMTGLATLVHAREQQLGRSARDDELEPLTQQAVAMGSRTTGMACAAAIGAMNVQVRRMAAFFESWDVLLTPTLAQPPARLGELTTLSGDVDTYGRMLARYTPFTGPFNASGLPAISLPLHWNAAGLPIGLQFVARFGGDATLLQLAATLERATPWFDRMAAVATTPA